MFVLFFILYFTSLTVKTSNINDLAPVEHNILSASQCRDRERIFKDDANLVYIKNVVSMSQKCLIQASNGHNSTTFQGVLNAIEKKLFEANGYHIVRRNPTQFVVGWSLL